MDTPHGAPAESSDEELRRFCAWGQVFKREKRYAEAAAAFAAALQIDAHHVEAHNDLGAVFHLVGNDVDAITQFRRALALDPHHVNALSNLATALLERNEVDEAIATYERALAIAPDQAKVRTFLGLAQLLRGDLKTGWQNYENRWAAGATRPASATGALWVGQTPLRGKSIWLANEQGLGDMILFSRYVRWVHGQGPSKIYLEAPPPLERLFSLSFGEIAEVRGIQNSVTKPFCDEVSTVPSLAFAAGTTLDSVPQDVPYLRAPKPREDTHWRLETLPRGLKVGLAWAGSATHNNDHRRSIPWSQFQQCLVHGHVCYVCIKNEVPEGVRVFGEVDASKGGPRSAAANTSAQSSANAATFEVADFRDCLHDMAETAAVIQALDLVIAVDTSVAHLAGALGKPVWVLLPFSPDWRWMLGRDDSPWYPSMRLFRQAKAGEWEPVFAQVRSELERSVRARAVR